MRSPYTMPIYLCGSLQYFADVRRANAFINSDSVVRRTSTEGGSSGDDPIRRPRDRAGAAAAFDLNSFMRWPA